MREVFFFTEDDALNIIHTLKDMINIFGRVYVSTYYDISGENWSADDEEFGWTNIDPYEINYSEGKYFIKLPNPIKL